MSVAPTLAAKEMEENADTLSSHRVISLLLDGALERVSQAKACVRDGNETDKVILISKLIGIVNGLRQSLNMDQGGAIAVNLEKLYLYMADRLAACENEEELHVLSEIGELIGNVKQGWDAIAEPQAG
ncbi:flagellar protein FliS [Alteromonadaceae bacterium Bs31]|nr:flagellar protein FliS [Alteromonadaceae bacterium Bs31]